jgi:heat shock protein HslJ
LFACGQVFRERTTSNVSREMFAACLQERNIAWRCIIPFHSIVLVKKRNMKRFVLLLSILAVSVLSCKKDNKVQGTEKDLPGNWRMIAVRDNTSGSTASKPSSITGDVDITFHFTSATDGNITGNTPTNTLIAEFTIGQSNTIRILALAATKAMETPWGEAFLDHVTQSQRYVFESNNRLAINTGIKTLVFQRR